jgi:hypothetical protein
MDKHAGFTTACASEYKHIAIGSGYRFALFIVKLVE